VLDLETSAPLIERLARALRRFEHEMIDIARDAQDTGAPGIAARLDQLSLEISTAGAIPEALAARAEFRAHTFNRTKQDVKETKVSGISDEE
jgi:hypothetical protein